MDLDEITRECANSIDLKKKKKRSYNRKEDQSNVYHMSPIL